MKTALSIAGSDCSGGAGIQADVFAMSAITALTAQNTTGVRRILEVSPEFLAQQINAVFEDIRPDAVKIGMVAWLIEAIGERLRFWKAEHIVVDPEMVVTSGTRLIEEAAVEALKRLLLPIADLVTPNIPRQRFSPAWKSKPPGHGGSGKNHFRYLPLCRALKGRPQHQRC